MGANTKIEWAHHTFNPWIGCTKVSPACDNCYAETLMDKRYHIVQWGGQRKRTSEDNWKKPLGWNGRAKHLGGRHRVFCASLADVFDNQVPNDWRRDLWALIAKTPLLDWMLLTKRPQNIAKMLPAHCGPEFANSPWPWPNVWLGTTVENQQEADRRIPHLLAVPARVHFLSCEPLLGPIDLTSVNWPEIRGHRVDALRKGYWNVAPHLFGGRAAQLGEARGGFTNHSDMPGKIDWVIVGGESGKGARPMDPEWALSLRDQCAAAGVAFHFKQWGAFVPDGQQLADGRTVRTGFDAAEFVRASKTTAGRLLDGRTHDEFPVAA